jgi:hypothetical protein
MLRGGCQKGAKGVCLLLRIADLLLALLMPYIHAR